MVMKKLGRKPAQLDGLELFRRLDKPGTPGPLADPARLDAVLEEIRAEVGGALGRPSSVHGWRAQSLFASLVVALDACELLTMVDTGDVFYDGDPVKPPDFMLVLRSGRRLLVEVKSAPPARGLGEIRLSGPEMEGMRRFATLYGAELYIAVLFGATGTWTLVDAARFRRDGEGRYRISGEAAAKATQMADLGDYVLGVRPEVRLDIYPDVSKPNTVEQDHARFTVGRAVISVDGIEMRTAQERRIAMFLLMWGTWPGTEATEHDGEAVQRLSFIARPVEHDSRAGFALIGDLSSMYTRWFIEATSDAEGITALDVRPTPGLLPTLIPADFQSDRLPLWRLQIAPS